MSRKMSELFAQLLPFDYKSPLKTDVKKPTMGYVLIADADIRVVKFQGYYTVVIQNEYVWRYAYKKVMDAMSVVANLHKGIEDDLKTCILEAAVLYLNTWHTNDITELNIAKNKQHPDMPFIGWKPKAENSLFAETDFVDVTSKLN
jgi:hypothetical protein